MINFYKLFVFDFFHKLLILEISRLLTSALNVLCSVIDVSTCFFIIEYVKFCTVHVFEEVIAWIIKLKFLFLWSKIIITSLTDYPTF